MFNLIKLPCSEEERLEERAAIFFSVSYDQLETAFKMIPAYKGFKKKRDFHFACVLKIPCFALSFLTEHAVWVSSAVSQETDRLKQKTNEALQVSLRLTQFQNALFRVKYHHSEIRSTDTDKVNELDSKKGYFILVCFQIRLSYLTSNILSKRPLSET